MRISVAVAVACLSMTGLSMADQAQAAVRRSTNIAAQGLAPALRLLARERDIQVVYRSDLVGGRETSGAVGEFTVEEALTKLLSGTGLTFQYLEDNGITIVPISTDSPRSSSSLAGSGKGEGSKKSLWDRFRVAQVDQGKSASGGVEKSAGTSDSNEGVRLEEIVVTAQKRKERLQDVPVSISVLSGEDLDRFTGRGVSEALAFVPGVTALEAPGGVDGGRQLGVRGVSAAQAAFNGSSPIAYYMDSVPFGLLKTASVPDINPYDLERIEVLRGPQGTLYGASALNGVVRILTHDADLNKFEFKTRTSVSTTEEGGGSYRGDAAINVPMIPGKLAARAVVGYNDASGWIDNPAERDTNDSTVRNLRLKINAQPTEQLSLGLSAWSSHSNFGSPPLADRQNGQDFWPGTGPRDFDTDYELYALKVGYEFPSLSLTSSTGYIDYENGTYVDVLNLGASPPVSTGDPLFSIFASRVFSQEITLQSTHEGAWRWSVGGFYRDSEDLLHQNRAAFIAPTNYVDLSESFAVFGELTRRFFDGKVELTGGLRYFEDEVTQVEKTPFDGNVSRPLLRDARTFDAVSPRVVLNWHPSEQTTVYGSYSEGFRSGFNQNPNIAFQAPEFPPADEDSLKNYEVGAKGSLLGGKLTYDTSLYYIDWEGVQQALSVQVPSNTLRVTAVVNGESASGPGFDLALTGRPATGLEIGVSVSWNDLKLDAPIIQQFSNPTRDVVLFREGDRMRSSYEYTVGAHAGYAFPLGGGGLDGRFEVAGTRTSERPDRFIVGPVSQQVSQEVYSDSLLNVAASFSVSAADRWTMTLFADNVTNERGVSVSATLPMFQGHVRPRTIGLQFEYRFY